MVRTINSAAVVAYYLRLAKQLIGSFLQDVVVRSVHDLFDYLQLIDGNVYLGPGSSCR